MYFSFKFSASLTVDTWSHTARASCKRKSSSSVLCHGLGNASFCGCYRSGSHCRSKHQTSHSRPPSVQAKPENLKWKYLGRVSTNMANDDDDQIFYIKKLELFPTENSSTFRAIKNCLNNLSHGAACPSLTTYSRDCKRSKASLRVKDLAICHSHSRSAPDSCEFFFSISHFLKWAYSNSINS